MRDVRFPFQHVSSWWRLVFVGGCAIGPLMTMSLGWGLGIGAVTSVVGAYAVSITYWITEDRRRTEHGAGWYPTRGEPGVLRWWDGERWSDERATRHPTA